MMFYIYILPAILASLFGNAKGLDERQADRLYVSSTARQLRNRGYQAEDHNIDVQGGAATINLVRATNPRINKGLGGLPDKEPLVFVHGIFTGANCFIANADGVRPKDYTEYNVSSMSVEQLARTLRNEPASKSLVFTALNFGHEVWLFNRRPTLESQVAYLLRHGFGDSFNPFNITDDANLVSKVLGNEYWDFSYDEQGYYDVPEVIDYILEQTGRPKLVYVGHSAGSLTLIITLSVKPEYADKISKAVLWAPAFYGRVMPFVTREILLAPIPFLAKVSLPVPSPALILPAEGIIGFVCKSQLLRSLICDPIVNIIFGPGAERDMIQNINSKTRFLDNVSSKELAQVLRSYTDGIILPFNRVADPSKMVADNELSRFNISRITLKTMSLWAGNADNLVPIPVLDQLIHDLSVRVDRHVVDERGILFNHLGYLLDDEIDELVVMPSYKFIAG